MLYPFIFITPPKLIVYTYMFILPLTSITCPLYNKRAYAKETIDLVIHHTYEYWEMKIIDGDSCETTERLIIPDFQFMSVISLSNGVADALQQEIWALRRLNI